MTGVLSTIAPGTWGPVCLSQQQVKMKGIGGMNVFSFMINKVPSHLFYTYCLIHAGPTEGADMFGRQQT